METLILTQIGIGSSDNRVIDMLLTGIITGTLLPIVYWICDQIYSKIIQGTYTSIVVDSTDQVYHWLLKYLTEKQYLEQSLNCLIAKIKPQKRRWWEREEDNKPEIEYLPAPGATAFNYKGYQMLAVQQDGKTDTEGWENKPIEYTQLSVIVPGKKTEVVKQMVEEAVDFSMDQEKGLLGIYEIEWGFRWVKKQTKKARPLDSVILDEDLCAQLVQDIRAFQGNGEWYKSKGIPYRRGYLLYGPPGTGKTSFTQAVAGELHLNLCYLNLHAENMNDDKLNKFLGEAPPHSIILLEDVDAMFIQREQGQSLGGGVSFSGFLNALDGVRSQEGQILFMTTNHIEKLDDALKRPGRADVQVKLNYASEKQIRDLFSRFYPEQAEKAQEFANKVQINSVSMAKLQGHFLKYRDQVEECILNAPDLMKTEDVADRKDFTVEDWLHHLNLHHLIEKFHKQGFRRMEDMTYFQEAGQFAEFDMADNKENKRMWFMLSGQQEHKDMFKMLDKHGLHNFMRSFIREDKLLKEIVDQLPEHVLTGFMLKDIFDKNSKLNQIKKALYDKVLACKMYARKKQVDRSPYDPLKDDEEEEEEKNKEIINFDLEGFFKDLGAPECINMFQKQDINDSRLFFKLEIGTIESHLGDLKPLGKKKRVFKAIKEQKEKFDKEGMITYSEKIIDMPDLKFARSVTSVNK